MKNISFALTSQQILLRTKTVTRRLGWRTLTPGTTLQPVLKGMGLKPGESVQRLGPPIEVLDVRREALRRMCADLEYGFAECNAEGFERHTLYQWPSEFVRFFCNSHKGCTPDTIITRIEFRYLAQT